MASSLKGPGLLVALMAACSIQAPWSEDSKEGAFELPESDTAVADSPDPEGSRLAVFITRDGVVWSDPSHSMGSVLQPEEEDAPGWTMLYDPEQADGYGALRQHLTVMAKRMKRGPVAQPSRPSRLDRVMRAVKGLGSRGDPSEVELIVAPPEEEWEEPVLEEEEQEREWRARFLATLPPDPLLIRADRLSPFRSTLKVMEHCGASDVGIWKLQLAAAGEKLLRVPLPLDVGVSTAEAEVDEPVGIRVEVTIKVAREGARLDPGGTRPFDPARDPRFTYDSTRALTYRVTHADVYHWGAEEEPIFEDVEISDRNEWEEEMRYESSEGDPDFLSDSPFDSDAFNDAVGLGGGGGIEQVDQERADRERDGLIRDLAELRQHLQELRAGHELAAATIDARSGTVTQEVVDVLDALRLAGVEQISFTGSYED